MGCAWNRSADLTAAKLPVSSLLLPSHTDILLDLAGIMHSMLHLTSQLLSLQDGGRQARSRRKLARYHV